MIDLSTFKQEVERYMEAGFPIIYLHTFEDSKACEAIFSAAESIAQTKILEWDGTGGICDARSKALLYDVTSPSLSELLDDRLSYQRRQILIFKNIDTFLSEPAVMARLKKMASMIHSGKLDTTIFILSPLLEIPREIEQYITIVEMDYLTVGEIGDVIRAFASNQAIEISSRLERELANAFKGLSEFEIENMLQLAMSENGELNSSQFKLILEQKKQVIKKSGILEMIPLKEGMEDIGGLENLKGWLNRKAKVLANMEQAKSFGVDVPKGVLIAGVPGCGKSLSAKAAANLFQVPLLRLDMGRLLGKYVGESEANMRKAIDLAEAISPCVLWIDELEKAFAGIGGEGSGAEVTTRLFGSFLTWLQEKETPVFVVATANDITKLPPELMRKGRFDEIFYVGLPQAQERRKIFEIHIRKRRKDDLVKIEMAPLLDETDGYSGADIEGVVRESVELAYSAGKSALTTEDIIQVIKSTHCLSEIMGDSIKKMESEYKNRKFKNA